jgi:hypothetical protein
VKTRAEKQEEIFQNTTIKFPHNIPAFKPAKVL